MLTKGSLLFLASFCVLLFQNCQKVGFTSSQAALESAGIPGTADPSVPHVYNGTSDTAVATDMNTPIEFTVNRPSNLPATIPLNFYTGTVLSSANGSFEIIDAANWKAKYTPNFGFRGKDPLISTVLVYDGGYFQVNITASVDNTVRNLEPALAVRGIGCIQCHAQVASNLLTDFGYKGNGLGHDYFFGQIPSQSWWNSGGIYGDHGNSVNSMTIDPSSAVIVPKANLPSFIALLTKLTTLADYIKSQLPHTTVTEKSSLYIGAPTDDNLISAFRMTPKDRFKYFKNTDDSVDLSGLVDKNTFFQNSGVLNCEGDLAIRGPVYFENLQINTRTGCRMYVIGSVFMFGPVTFTTVDASRNLQITSSRSISMGLGAAKKNGAFCESTSRWAQNSTDPSYAKASSLLTRYRDIWTAPGFFVRQTLDPIAYGNSILAEADTIQSAIGTFYDAACRPEGRSVSFERILLNAPIVHSRYQGNVSGTVIAEFSIMSLGSFKFQFDSVFKTVPILPFLDKSNYLDVED